MATNFNVAPYYDDFDVNNGYLRILFKPGVSVQARELTQLQSILQNQIKSLSDHFFKEGAMVVPGQSAVDFKATYVKIDLNGTGSYTNASDFVGRTLTGGTSGIKAVVVHAEASTGTEAADDPDTIYVKYLKGTSGSGTNEGETFVQGTSLSFFSDEVLSTEAVTGQSDFSCVVRPTNETPTGVGSIAFIEAGIYYVQGHLVIVDSQSIVLDKYTNTPSYKIGLQINESTIDYTSNSGLLDNAQGTPNFNSPGADRYKIQLTLHKRGIDEINTENFVSLISVRTGQIESAVRSTEYSVLEDTLARRTYDESGDYTVRPYRLDIRELLNENGNRGVRTVNDFQYNTEVEAKAAAIKNFSDSVGMQDSITNSGLAHTISPADIQKYPDQNLDDTGQKFYPGRTHDNLVNALRARMGLGVETGKAYVRGYELENLSTVFVNYKKARDDVQENNSYLLTDLGNCVYVTDIHGLPSLNSSVNLLNIHAEGITGYITANYNLSTTSQYASDYDPDGGTFADASNTHGADVIGTAKVKYIQYYSAAGSYQGNDSFTTGANKFAPATNSVNAAIYKVYLYDIKFNQNPTTLRPYQITDMRSITSQTDVTGSSLVKTFSGNTLVEYTLTDVDTMPTVNNMIYSQFQDITVRGMVYYVDAGRQNILVKNIGGGNFTDFFPVNNFLNPRLFELNEIVQEVGYNASAGTDVRFSGTTVYERKTGNARIINRQVLFGANGNSLVDTGKDFVKTNRFVDDESGNTTVDTTYTVLREVQTTVFAGGSDNRVEIQIGNSIPEQFMSFNQAYYFVYIPSDSSASSAQSLACTNANVIISSDFKTLTITGFPAGSLAKSVSVFFPVIKQTSREKTKTLNDDTVIFPYTGKGTNGQDLGILIPFGTNTDVAWAGNSGDVIGQSAVNNVVNQFSDAANELIDMKTFQLQHSDIYKFKKIYDTNLTTNVIYQVDVIGTQKFIHEMNAAELEFATKAYEWSIQNSGASPYTTTSTGAPFITEINAATAAGQTPAGESNQPMQIYDITERYEFDDGQRGGFYDIGTINILPGQQKVQGRAAIVYSYFSHGDGDYASVDSYVPNSGITYEEIPSFQKRRLSDVLDFRPATTFSFNTNSLLGRGILSGDQPELPLDTSNVITDFRYYLPRKDLLYLNRNGQFFIKYGASDDNPSYPENPDDGMVLYRIEANAYTLTVKDVRAEMLDNKRYTMRDIGKLEERIKRIEYYTSLSLLEKETEDMSITDENGVDRFKNGFVVEPFRGFQIADVFDRDLQCSIDSAKGELRPKASEKNVPMKFWQAGSSDFANKDGNLMLPYISISSIKQNKASKTINVNPFAIFGFQGNMRLIPESDEWRDVEARPDLVIDRDGQFDQIQELAEDAGILGTEWNSWQTTWTGSDTSTNTFNETRQQWDSRGRQNGWSNQSRQVTQTITTNSGFNSRDGIQTEVVPRVVTENLGERTLSTEIIPFIRSRTVFFRVSGLKPQTRMYPFFDSVAVGAHCFVAEEVVVSSMTQSAASFITAQEDAIRSDSGQVFLRGNSSGHQTRVFDFEYLDTNSVRFFCLSNIDSLSFTTSEPMFFVTDTGTSVRVGNFSTSVNSTPNQTLLSDEGGNLRGLFTIPNNENLRFRTGDRLFRLTDQLLVTSTDSDTEAEARYTARGLLETTQQTIVNTRMADIVRTARTQRGNSVTNQSTTNSTGGWEETGFQTVFWSDPLAETFLIDTKGGEFITAIDLFFSTKPSTDNGIPVRCEIRNTVNGYPGQKVLAKKELSPREVSISEDGSIATTFTFDSPVHVQENGEYCFVVLADTQDYRMWIARLGEEDTGGTGIISKQPYAGVFFKSQNASTWTADQMEDMKFEIYRAQFDTTKQSTLYFQNNPVDKNGARTDFQELRGNCIETTAGSSVVKFYVKNHDLVPSRYNNNHYWVTIANLKTNAYFGGGPSEGFSGVELNATHKVVDTTLDSFSIDMNNPRKLDAAGIGMGLPVEPTLTEATGLGRTAVTSGLFPAEAQASDGSSSGNLVGQNLTREVTNADGTTTDVPIAVAFTNKKFDVMMPIVQNVQLPETNISMSMKTTSGTSQHSDLPAGVKDPLWNSFVNMENIYFKTPRFIANRFNELQFGIGSSDFDKRSLTYKIQLSSDKDNVSPMVDTRRNSAILVSNRVNSPQFTTTTDAQGNATDSGVSITSTGYMYNGFISERDPQGGSADAKYITREIVLNNPSVALKVAMTVNRPQDADIDLYYKIKTTDGQNYRKLNYDYVSRPLGYDNPDLPGSWSEWEYDIENLEEFSSFGIKVVLRSKNSATVPKVKDLRIVALAS